MESAPTGALSTFRPRAQRTWAVWSWHRRAACGKVEDMEVQAFTIVPVPLVDAEAALMHRPSDWLPAVRKRDRWQWHPTASVNLGHRLRFAHKRVRFEFGAFHPGSDASIPFRWRARGFGWVMPAMHGVLALSIDGEITGLSLKGVYTPPFGAFGRWIDKRLLHRFAQRTAEELVSQIGGRIATLVALDRSAKR